MREGFAVLHGVSMRVEEVVWSGDHFIADRGIEVTRLNRQAVSDWKIHFHIGLRKRQTIETLTPTGQMKIVIASIFRNTPWAQRGCTVSLGENSIGTVHHVNAATDIKIIATDCDRALKVTIELVHLKFARAVTEGDRAVEFVGRSIGIGGNTKVRPTTPGHAIIG